MFIYLFYVFILIFACFSVRQIIKKRIVKYPCPGYYRDLSSSVMVGFIAQSIRGLLFF